MGFEIGIGDGSVEPEQMDEQIVIHSSLITCTRHGEEYLILPHGEESIRFRTDLKDFAFHEDVSNQNILI